MARQRQFLNTSSTSTPSASAGGGFFYAKKYFKIFSKKP
jgi:hypothetical protein